MTRLELAKETDSDDEINEIFNDIQKSLGVEFTPNFFLSIAKNKTALKGIYGMYKGILFEGDLSRSIKELIFLTVSLELKCHYCSSVHLAINDQINHDEMKMVIDDILKIENESTRTVLMFALKAIKETKQVTQDDFNKLYEVGLTEGEAMEVLAMASMAMNAINMTKALDIEVEPQVNDYLENQRISVGF